MGLVALGMVVSLGSRVIQDKAQNRLGKVLTYAGQIAIALERERKGLDPGARPEDARQTVVGLLQASRSGLLEHEGYLAMPGVRLRKR